MVTHWSEKNLRLMFQSPERFGVDDSIPVMLEGWPERAFLLKGLAASRL